MAQTAVLHKILNVREQEKKDAQLEQSQAIDHFEKVAKKLYYTLKTKEDAEVGLNRYIKSESTINKIKEQSLYIDMLNKKITTLQKQVQDARQEMELKQAKLTEAHKEVKKIEKMIEKREQTKQELEKKAEMLEMDELSIRQFMNQSQN